MYHILGGGFESWENGDPLAMYPIPEKVYLEVEPGQYGIQGSLGWGKVVGSTGGTRRWMHTVYWGWAVRGVVVRQWGSDYGPLGVGPQTLLGIEGNLSIVRLNFTAGVLRSLSSVSNEEWVVTGSLGWGF